MNNHQVIKEKMEKTFANQWYEVVQEMPFIAEFESRWPALFMENEVSLEFEGNFSLFHAFNRVTWYCLKLTHYY